MSESPPRNLAVPRESRGERIDKFLSRAMPGTSKERIAALLQGRFVSIGGKPVQATRKLWGGESVEVKFPPPRGLPKVVGPVLSVLAEIDDALIIEKPAGFPVEPEPGQISIFDLLASQRSDFDVDGLIAPGIVHRLDKETTGCLMVGRNDAGVTRLKEAFERGEVDKRYLALVLGEPPDTGSVETPYAKDPANPRKYTTKVPSARRAALSFEVRERFPGAALVEVKLDTGRTHQIRVQLSESGWPVLGDPIYGNKQTREHPAAVAMGRLGLHAERLRVEVLGLSAIAPLPADLKTALELLRR